MLGKIILNNKEFDGLGWFLCGGAYCLIAKKINEEYYTHLQYEDLKGLWGRPDLAQTIPKEYLHLTEFKKEEDILYELDEKTNMNIMYDMIDSWIVTLSNKEDNERIISYIHEDVTEANHCNFLVKNIEKYKKNKVKYKRYEITEEDELKKILEENEDLIIVKELGVPLYSDNRGCLRFSNEKELTLTTKMISLDLNKAWESFYNKKHYTLLDMMNYYTETESSISHFMGVFENLMFKSSFADNSYLIKNMSKILKENIERSDKLCQK
jgi:hypothetical protein